MNSLALVKTLRTAEIGTFVLTEDVLMFRSK